MERKHNHESEQLESGQVIVIMGLVIVGLLAALGLTIDGGGLFFLSRDAQNASDAAVLYSAYALCSGDTSANVVAAGYQGALDNGFDNNGVDNWVTVENPPSEGPYAGDDAYIRVNITAHKPAYFIQIVYPGPLEVNIDATAFCIPEFDPATVPAMYATGSCTNGIAWTGSSGSFKGGAYANTFNFQSATYVHEGDLEYSTPGGFSGNTIIWGPNAAAVGPIDPPDQTLEVNTAEFAPGGRIYERIIAAGGIAYYVEDDGSSSGPNSWWTPSGKWDPPNGTTLRGLYYVTGEVSIANSVNIHPEGASIISEGPLDFNAKDGIDYYFYGHTGANDDINTEGIFLASLAVSPNCGTDVLSFSGNSTNVLGVMWTPNGGVNTSQANGTFIGAIVGQNITISGSNLVFEYDPTLLPPKAPRTGYAE